MREREKRIKYILWGRGKKEEMNLKELVGNEFRGKKYVQKKLEKI